MPLSPESSPSRHSHPINESLRNKLVGRAGDSRQNPAEKSRSFSRALPIDNEALARLSEQRRSEAELQLQELSELLPQLSPAESAAVMGEAAQMANSADRTQSMSRERSQLYLKVLRLVSALLLLGVLNGNFASTAEAATPTPTVTPTAEATKKATATTAVESALPTVTPTPETIIETIVTSTTTANVNARKGPGTTYGVETVIPEGTTVTRIGLPQNGWIQISFELDGVAYGESEKLYVSVDFLSEPKSQILQTQKEQVTAVPTAEVSPAVTETEGITSTTVLTGEVDTEAVGGSTSSVTLDSTGFPTAEMINGEQVPVKAYTNTEFSQLREVEGERLIEELPKQLAVNKPDGTFEVIPLTPTILANTKFAVTQEGIYSSISVNTDTAVVMKWEGGLKYREDWVIPQFDGKYVSVALSSAFNDIHPNREIILQGKKQYLFGIHNGTVEETLASGDRREAYVNNPEYLAWYQEYDFIEKNPQPIEVTPEYDSSIKLDNLISTMWEKLEPLQKDGMVTFPGLDKSVAIGSKVNITIWRFPDDDSSRLGWHDSDNTVSTLPQHFYQISDNGVLTIHITPDRTGSHNMSSIITGAVSELMVHGLGFTPDYMDVKKPILKDINNSTYDYVKIDDAGNMATILPVYIDAGEDAEGTWKKIK